MRRAANIVLAVFVFLISISAFATERQPNADYRARREALAQKTDGGIVVLFAATESEGPNAIYGFRQDENFYYLTGLPDPGAALLIAPAKDKRPYTEILFLPAQNAVEEKWTGPKLNPTTPDAKQRTGFDRVAQLDTIRDELVKLLPPGRGTVLTDMKGPSAEPFEWLRRTNALPNTSVTEVKPLLAALRTKKDPGEIALIRKATDASVAAHLAAFKAIKPGVTEREIAALMQYEFGRRGCERPAYAPIVGSGFYSTVLHYSEDSGTMKDGDVTVMDVGGEYSMYATDVTRTVPVNGKFTPRQREIYDIVLGAQQAAAAAFKAGQSTLRMGPNALHNVAMEYINTHGKDKHGDPLGKYFIHGLSHYVGLNVHDPGDQTPLQPGAVFTIEPGIYIPEENIGVRIEDTFWVNDQGQLVNLSGALPSKAEDVERVMAQGAAAASSKPK